MTPQFDRRTLLQTTGLALAGTLAGCSSGGGSGDATTTSWDGPDLGAWLSGVDGGLRDARGESTVTVDVGAQGNGGHYAFSPAGLWVDAGTKVEWHWTGDGGGHNVHAEKNATFKSELHSDAGVHFSHTFDAAGVVVQYQCDPHSTLGMRGAVAVADAGNG